MKRLLLAVVSIMFAATSFAQNELVASLSHEGDVTYFYGMAALQNAVAAATNSTENVTTIDSSTKDEYAGKNVENRPYIYDAQYSAENQSSALFLFMVSIAYSALSFTI